MIQKPSSVPLFCQNLTTAILFCQVLQNILTNSQRSKILLPAIFLESSQAWTHQTPPSETFVATNSLKNPVYSHNSLLQFFHWKLPSLSFWTPDCLPSIQTTLFHFWHNNLLHTFHKNKDLWTSFFFFSWAQHSGTLYCMMFVTQH